MAGPDNVASVAPFSQCSDTLRCLSIFCIDVTTTVLCSNQQTVVILLQTLAARSHKIIESAQRNYAYLNLQPNMRIVVLLYLLFGI